MGISNAYNALPRASPLRDQSFHAVFGKLLTALYPYAVSVY